MRSKKGRLAADFEADVADGFSVGDRDLTDGFLVGDRDLLATDFFNGFNGFSTDFFNGFNGWVFWWVIEICWQRIFLTDLTDGFLVGDRDLLATDFFNGFNGWVFGG